VCHRGLCCQTISSERGGFLHRDLPSHSSKAAPIKLSLQSPILGGAISHCELRRINLVLKWNRAPSTALSGGDKRGNSDKCDMNECTLADSQVRGSRDQLCKTLSNYGMTTDLNFRERIADVEQLLGIDDPKPLIVKVSRTERILMELLLRRNMLTREVAWGVLYGHRPDADQPQYRVISTIIHHLRSRLSPHGVEITTEYGTGWYLQEKDREKLEQLLACKP
jgi:hypothetical protein